MYDKRQKIEKLNIAVLGFRSDVFLFECYTLKRMSLIA